MPTDFDQYSTAKPLLSALPAWINSEFDQKRIAAYQLYEEIYWTAPESFKLETRGQDAFPIYVPAGRIIVETMNRYLANAMTVTVDPEFGSDTEKALANQVMTDLVRRERFYSRFAANKRYGIIRGDWLWHLYADPLRPPGARISIFPIDPASYFPILNPDNLDEIIGAHIVDQFLGEGEQGLEKGKAYIRRLTYRKATEAGGPSPITAEDAIYEVDAWGGPNMDEKIVKQISTVHQLPPPIDSLPIYHIQNFFEPGSPWGSSEMRGLERIMAAVNQTISDEDLTLAMDGLGVYATNAGQPIDPDTGEDAGWNLGPARVVEVPHESFFNRVSGTGSVTPYQDHLAYLHEQIDLATGGGQIARGRVTDVQVAESGVAMLIELAPIINLAVEKEQVVTDVMTNMLFDLAKWYVAYEGSAFNSLMEVTRWVPAYGPKIPPNDQKQFDNIMAMVVNKVIPMEVAWDMLRTLGYELPENTEMMGKLLSETQATATVEADAMATRINGEIQQTDALAAPGAQ